MTSEQYAAFAQRTSNTKTPYDKVINGMLGLIGESGQVVDVVKKMQYQDMGAEKAREKILDEAGDVLWYIAEMCVGMNMNIPDADTSLIGYGLDDGTAPSVMDLSLMLANQATKISDIIMRQKHLPYIDDMSILMYKIKTILTILNVLLKSFCCMTLDDAATKNIAKLRNRYPNGFNKARSNERY